MILVKCDNCGKEFECQEWRMQSREHLFCSKKCEGGFRKKHNPNYIPCEICGKIFYYKPCQQKKNKHHCCSIECASLLKKETYKGENNHQYGLKGSLNASWKSDEKITNYGYKKIRKINHPFKDCDGFVFEHRLVAERYLLTDENSVEIDGEKYLKPEFIVHHKNHNKLDNRKENLKVMTLAEHTSIHVKERLNK